MSKFAQANMTPFSENHNVSQTTAAGVASATRINTHIVGCVPETGGIINSSQAGAPANASRPDTKTVAREWSHLSDKNSPKGDVARDWLIFGPG